MVVAGVGADALTTEAGGRAGATAGGAGYCEGPPEALRTWLGQTLFAHPFSHFIQS